MFPLSHIFQEPPSARIAFAVSTKMDLALHVDNGFRLVSEALTRVSSPSRIAELEDVDLFPIIATDQWQPGVAPSMMEEHTTSGWEGNHDLREENDMKEARQLPASSDRQMQKLCDMLQTLLLGNSPPSACNVSQEYQIFKSDESTGRRSFPATQVRQVNNPFGRAGIKKCNACRRSKKKVVPNLKNLSYDSATGTISINLAHGADNGLACTSKDKISPPKQRPPHFHDQMKDVFPISRYLKIPENRQLSQKDRSCLDFYFKYRNAVMMFGFPWNRSDKELMWLSAPSLPASKLEFPIHCKSLRYAVLALISAALSGHRSIQATDTMHYLTKCYAYTREAISKSSFEDIVYTCYTVILITCYYDASLAIICHHLSGMSLALKEISFNSEVADDEYGRMLEMWECVFRLLWCSLWRARYELGNIFQEELEKACGILEIVDSSLPNNKRFISRSPKDIFFNFHQVIDELEIYMQYYLARYIL